MTNDERNLLSQFLSQLVEVKGIQKDSEAAKMIGQAVALQPDAGYLLVQKAILQDQALAAAKAQIARLESQVQNTGSAGSFLGDNTWGNPARAAGAAAPGYSPPAPGYRAPGPVAAAAPATAPSGGGPSAFGSFLGQAAATAAGVAGGAFLFQGIESLLGHGTGGFGTMGSGSDVVENVTVNNYYGDQADQSTAADNNIDDSLIDASDDVGDFGTGDFGSGTSET